jgi:hypothetical protein
MKEEIAPKVVVATEIAQVAQEMDDHRAVALHLHVPVIVLHVPVIVLHVPVIVLHVPVIVLHVPVIEPSNALVVAVAMIALAQLAMFQMVALSAIHADSVQRQWSVILHAFVPESLSPIFLNM